MSYYLPIYRYLTPIINLILKYTNQTKIPKLLYFLQFCLFCTVKSLHETYFTQIIKENSEVN